DARPPRDGPAPHIRAGAAQAAGRAQPPGGGAVAGGRASRSGHKRPPQEPVSPCLLSIHFHDTTLDAVRSLGGEKQSISRIFGLVPIGVAKCVQRSNELDSVLSFDFDACEHASIIGSVISIVEKRNVPIGSQAFEEGQQRAGTLRKFESIDEFVL